MGLAEVVLPDDDDTLDAYRRLLGPDDSHTWALPNARLRLSAGSDNVVYFGSDDAAATARLLTRRGLQLEDTACGPRVRGLPVGVTADSVPPGVSTTGTGIDAVDHLVFVAADRDHAIALFGASLELNFRLAQAIPGVTEEDPAAAVTQLFFRRDRLVVEVLAMPDAVEPVSFWGVAWRAADLMRSRELLCDNGFDVSEIRAGRKPGTRVCTVRDRTLAVRTLLIEHSGS